MLWASAGELAGDPVKPDHAVQAAGGQLQLGPEVVQVPAQALLVFGACLDEVLAVIEQELQLQRRLSRWAAGRVSGPSRKRGAGDSKGIDRVGLAASALAACAKLPISFGGTRTTRSPEAIRKRSKRA